MSFKSPMNTKHCVVCGHAHDHHHPFVCRPCHRKGAHEVVHELHKRGVSTHELRMPTLRNPE